MPFDPYELLRPAFDPDYGTDQDVYRGYVDKYMEAVFNQQKVQRSLDIVGIDVGDIVFAQQGVADLGSKEQQFVNSILKQYAPSYAAKRPLGNRPGSPASIGSVGSVSDVVSQSTALSPVPLPASRSSVDDGPTSVPARSMVVAGGEASVSVVMAGMPEGDPSTWAADPSLRYPGTSQAAWEGIWEQMSPEERRMTYLARTGQLSQQELEVLFGRIKVGLERIEEAELINNTTGATGLSSTFQQASDEQAREILGDKDAKGVSGFSVETGQTDSMEAALDAAQDRRIQEAIATGQTGLEGEEAEYGAYAFGFKPIQGMDGDEQDRKMRAQWNSLQNYEGTVNPDVLQIGITGYKAFENKRGKEFFQTPGGTRGRNINEDVIVNMEKAIKTALLRNFDKLITSHTGALRLSVEKGHLEQDATSNDNVVTFVFRLDYSAGNGIDESQLGEGVRPNSSKSSVNARTKQAYGKGPEFYGPIVFAGRREIISQRSMVFKTDRATSGWVRSRHIGEAKARDITTMEQRDIINFADAISSAYARKLFDALVSQAAYDFKKADD